MTRSSDPSAAITAGFDGAAGSVADPLAALRLATASRHERLDSGLAIGAPDASLRDYQAHLLLLRGWLAPLQDWLEGFGDGPQQDGRFDQRARLALIEADLAEPGMAVLPASIPASSAPWPPHASPAWRWGVCYVIEGSQLGGAVLYARLARQLAPHPLRTLKGDPAGPGPRWRAFMLALRAEVTSAQDIAEACAGACSAFDRILALA